MSTSKQYGAITRTYTIRNYHEAVLTPGADIVVPIGSNDRFHTASEFSPAANPDTNYIPRRVGVFSNFADGLIFKNPSERLDVYMLFHAYRFGTSFSVDLTYGSKAVTVSAGSSGWSAGVIYPTTIGGYPVLITAINATTGTLEDYWSFGATGTYAAVNLVSLTTAEPYVQRNISTLNTMYEVNRFAEPFSFGAGLNYDIITLTSAINGLPAHTTSFLTDTIDVAFTGETVFFDVVIDIEFTGAN